MNLVRLVLILLLIPICLYAIKPVGQRSRFVRLFLFLGFSITAVTSLIVPKIWTRISEFAGLASGTDFLLYVLIVMTFVHIGYSHRRIRELERRITAIVQDQAINDIDRS